MTAEEWQAAADAAIEAYRAGSLQKEDAVARLKALGVSEGDASRWLGKVRPKEG